MEETSTEAMVNTSATGDFIDQDFVTPSETSDPQAVPADPSLQHGRNT